MLGAVRQAAGRVGTRAFRSSRVNRGGHGHDDGGYEYLHAKHMYKFREKPASKLKAGVCIFGGVALGVFIPIFAVDFSQRKAGLK